MSYDKDEEDIYDAVITARERLKTIKVQTEVDYKFWSLFPQINLNIHYPSIELWWFCYGVTFILQRPLFKNTTALEIMNKCLLQFLFIRLCYYMHGVERMAPIWGNPSKIVKVYGIMFFVVPLTGWGKDYLYLGKDKYIFFNKPK